LRCGLSQNYISLLEQNYRVKSPTLKTLEKIAIALNCCPLKIIECCHCGDGQECKRNIE
jgi:transcriptional regulator with XRE-family HTH domain